MKRPSFQFYPGDWLSNGNLRRCTDAEQGVWVRVLCVLHDQDEYGVARWTLKELAQAANTTVKMLKSLVQKGVLKGADAGEKVEAFVYVPRSGRKDGDPVALIKAQDGPLWYSSRLVRDEYVRIVRGSAAGIGDGEGATSKGASKGSPKGTPKPSPNPPFGEDIGEGFGPCARGRSSSSSSSGINSVTNVTGAEAPQPLTAHESIFRIGIPWLVANGAKESNVRSMLGGAVKKFGDGEAWEMMQDCMREEPMEPVAWLAKAINTRGPAASAASQPKNRAQARHDGLDAAAAEFAARMAAKHGGDGPVEAGYVPPDDGMTFEME